MNELNLIFGPKIPPELDAVGLAFVSVPSYQPDTSIGNLSAERYARQNYSHKEDFTIFADGLANSFINVEYTIPPITGVHPVSGMASFSSTVQLDNAGKYSISFLNSPITVKGIKISNNKSWLPLIQNGTFWRTGYTVKASGIEPEDSWLRKALPNTEDHNVILIYSIPEMSYSSVGSSAASFPPGNYVTNKETAIVSSPDKITYFGDIDELLELKINGTVKFTGSYTGVESSTYLKELNRPLKYIQTKVNLGPDDTVELKYKSFANRFVYTGFRSASGFQCFDCNPEAGHFICDNQGPHASADLLLPGITLYLVPSAALKYSFVPAPSGSSVLGTLKMQFLRAVNYGETHFVRHIEGISREQISLRDGGTTANTWGYATFGRNYYDEVSVTAEDLFSSTIPSMVPIGRILLTAPASVNSINVADIRARGGGVPDDYSFESINTEEDGTDTLRSFYDLGIWEGKAIKKGGVAEFEIDRSLLKTDENDPNPNTFLASEIYDIVKRNVPPGTAVEIKYVN